MEFQATLEQTAAVGQTARKQRKKQKAASSDHGQQKAFVQQLGVVSSRLQQKPPSTSKRLERPHSSYILENDDAEVDLEDCVLDSEWNTFSWNADKIKASLETLYEQVENSDDIERRDLAARMIMRLLKIHEKARTMMLGDLEILSSKCFCNIRIQKDITKCFRVAALVSKIATMFPSKVSREHATSRSVSILTCDMETSCRIIQHRWRRVLVLRGVGKRTLNESSESRSSSWYRLKMIDLKSQWHSLQTLLNHRYLPDEAVISYLTILHILVANPSSKTALSDRSKFILNGGMVVITRLIDREGVIGKLCKSILFNLAQVAQVVAEIIKSNVVETLAQQALELHKSASSPDDELLLIYNILQVLSFNSIEITELEEIKFLTGLSEVEDIQEYRYKRTNLATLVRRFLALPAVIDAVIKGIYTVNPQLNLICLLTLQNLAATSAFFVVLDSLLRLSGKALEQVVRLLQHPNYHVVEAAVAVLRKVFLRPEARGGALTAGVVEMIRPMCAGGIRLPNNKYKFVIGLTALAYAIQEQTHSDAALVVLDVSGPETFVRVYRALYENLSSCNGLELEAVATTVLSHRILDYIIDLVVHVVHDMKLVQNIEISFMGTTVISRLLSCKKITQAYFSKELIEYLGLILQNNRLEHSEKNLRALSSTLEHQFHSSTKEACCALTQLAKSSTYSSVKVAQHLIRFHALEDILFQIHTPTNVVNSAELEIELIASAIRLMTAISPLSLDDDDLVPPPDQLELESQIQSILQTLTSEVSSPLLGILASDPCPYPILEAACHCLAQFSSSNSCCSTLLANGCGNILSNLVPVVASKGSNTMEEAQLLALPWTLFRLAAKLVRIEEGKKRFAKLNLVGRILQRLRYSHPSTLAHDIYCKMEICSFVANLANVNTPDIGNLNEVFVQYEVPQHLLELARTTFNFSSPMEKTKLDYRLSKAVQRLVLDVMGIVPLLIHVGVFDHLSRWLLEYTANQAPIAKQITRQTLISLEKIGSYPNGKFAPAFQSSGVVEEIMKIAYSFQLELRQHSSTLSQPTIGEIARECLNHLKAAGVIDTPETHASRGMSPNYPDGFLPQTAGSCMVKPWGIIEEEFGETTLPELKSSNSSPAIAPTARSHDFVRSSSGELAPIVPIVHATTSSLLHTRPPGSATTVPRTKATSLVIEANTPELLKTRPPGSSPYKEKQISKTRHSQRSKPKPKLKSIDRPHTIAHYEFVRPKRQSQQDEEDDDLALDPVFTRRLSLQTTIAKSKLASPK